MIAHQDGFRVFTIGAAATVGLEELAEGGSNAALIAEADADAAATYADAYGKDPQFYDFYRAMESYRQTFINGEGNSSMVLDADNEYFNQFNGR